ncbi:MAG: site-specific integrase, partial [Candidatus Acidiferrales bacterium]
CFTLAIKRGHLHSKPAIELLPVSNARQGFFEDADFRKLYAELPADLKDYALFAFLTAWRKSEVSCLKWKYLENGVLRIPGEETKNGIARSVVIAGELCDVISRREAAALAAQREATPGVVPIKPEREHFIFNRDGERITEFRKAWASACKRAGCLDSEGEPRLFHDLRRSGVRNMIRSGVPQSVAMKCSGHLTTAMFRRYDVCNETDLKMAAESVQRYNAAQSAAAQQSNVVSIGGAR